MARMVERILSVGKTNEVTKGKANVFAEFEKSLEKLIRREEIENFRNAETTHTKKERKENIRIVYVQGRSKQNSDVELRRELIITIIKGRAKAERA